MSSNMDFLAGANVSVRGQSFVPEFALGLTANNGPAITSGNAVTYSVTTTTQGYVSSPIAVVTLADLADIIESDRAMADARVHGTKSWARLRRELDL